jgi:hypothetical protein
MWVIAVPAPLGVERDDKDVAAFELVQQPGAAAAPGDGFAQRPREALEHRRAHQELARVRRLARRYLVPQIVDAVAIAGRHPRQRRRAIVGVAQRQRDQVQPGDPSLRPLLGGRDLLRRELQPVRPVEQGGRLVVAEAQLRGADLVELAARPSATGGSAWPASTRWTPRAKRSTRYAIPHGSRGRR